MTDRTDRRNGQHEEAAEEARAQRARRSRRSQKSHDARAKKRSRFWQARRELLLRDEQAMMDAGELMAEELDAAWLEDSSEPDHDGYMQSTEEAGA